ncbi:MAG: DUF2778 domain-containing protein [Hyphomicrobiaceae bacterium]
MGLTAAILLYPCDIRAQKESPDTPTSAARIADFFGSIGDEIFKECIFELSEEQIQAQQALVEAYIAQGASGQTARRLAAMQIQPPKPSPRCEQIRRMPGAAMPGWAAKTVAPEPQKPRVVAKVRPSIKRPPSRPISLAGMEPLKRWDCGPDVDYVTIRHNGYPRKLTGGEICNPFRDVVRELPAEVRDFRIGYSIRTGRLFVVAPGSSADGRTITWGLSGRDVCRNNPDPDCLATRAVGPLPPGEYSFAKGRRVTWGPKTKRLVAAIYLSKLWHRERFGPRHTAAILARGNIAIHMRLKGEMSEACIGLEPKGWAYVAELIKDGRATGLNAYIDDPYPQVAEKPPIIAKSSFSLTSLFK